MTCTSVTLPFYWEAYLADGSMVDGKDLVDGCKGVHSGGLKDKVVRDLLIFRYGSVMPVTRIKVPRDHYVKMFWRNEIKVNMQNVGQGITRTQIFGYDGEFPCYWEHKPDGGIEMRGHR